MSRIGKMPVIVPQGTKFEIKGNVVEVTGPLGKLKTEIHPAIKVSAEGSNIILSRENDDKVNRSLHGMMRSMVNNMFIGVTRGFEKKLSIIGLGFRAETKGRDLILYLGFSHPVEFPVPEGINITIGKQELTISGIDNQLVGEISARIRKLKKPEPYKGKGIRYIDEVVKKKAGKAAISAGFGTGTGAGAK